MLAPARQNDQMFYLGATLVGVGVWAALVLLYGLLVYRPIVANDRQNREDAAHLAELLRASGQAYENHRGLRGELSELETRIATTLARVPDEPQEAEFLQQVSGLAETAGVEILDYSQADTAKLDTHSELLIHMSCAAPYPALCKFLHGVETLPRLTKVTSLEVQTATTDALPRVELTYVVYFGIVAEHEVALADDEQQEAVR